MKKQIRFYFYFFIIGLIIGIQIVRRNYFPYNIIRDWKHSRTQFQYDASPYTGAWKLPEIKGNGYENMLVPIEFYPKYSVVIDDSGNQQIVEVDGIDTITIETNNVGLILVDTWGYGNEESAPRGIVKDQKTFLKRSRQTNMTIIHAPNLPVVNKYPQYQKIKKIVQDSLSKYEIKDRSPVFLKSPGNFNEVWDEERKIRKKAKAPIYIESPRSERDISIHLTPTKDEYVINSHNELRYVIWRHHIKLLLYMGGAMNECMLLRPTGINRLRNAMPDGKKPLPITIVALEDCSAAGGSSTFDNTLFKKAISDFYKQNIAFISSSYQIKFY